MSETFYVTPQYKTVSKRPGNIRLGLYKERKQKRKQKAPRVTWEMEWPQHAGLWRSTWFESRKYLYFPLAQNLSGIKPGSHDLQLSADSPAHTPSPSVYSALVNLWLVGTWWGPTQSKVEPSWALFIHENDFSLSSERPNHISILFCLPQLPSFSSSLVAPETPINTEDCELTSAPSAHRASSLTS